MKDNNLNFENSTYTLGSIFAVRHKFKIPYRQIELRQCSSFVYVLSGNMKYQTLSGEFCVRGGDALYLPKYSSYSHMLLDNNVECLQVSFDLEISTSHTHSFPLICSEPTPVYHCKEEFLTHFLNLLDGFYNKSYRALSELYELMSLFEETLNEKPKTYGKITPAVNFINSNFTQKIYIQHLADLCGISQSHLRRLFNEYLGMSPIRYKNKILTDNACTMLKSGIFNVGEVSDSLHFADVYTFSQAFKSAVGMSPNEYKKSFKE